MDFQYVEKCVEGCRDGGVIQMMLDYHDRQEEWK